MFNPNSRVTGIRWRLSQLPYGEGRVAPGTTGQFIAGPHRRNHPFTRAHTHTPKDNLVSFQFTSHARVWTVGGSQQTQGAHASSTQVPGPESNPQPPCNTNHCSNQIQIVKMTCYSCDCLPGFYSSQCTHWADIYLAVFFCFFFLENDSLKMFIVEIEGANCRDQTLLSLFCYYCKNRTETVWRFLPPAGMLLLSRRSIRADCHQLWPDVRLVHGGARTARRKHARNYLRAPST